MSLKHRLRQGPPRGRGGFAADEVIRLGVLTDIHFYSSWVPDATTGPKLFNTAPAKMDAFVDAMNDLDPDLVISLGDHSEDEALADNHTDFLAAWGDITSPKALTIGNHDFYEFREDVNTTTNPDEMQSNDLVKHSYLEELYGVDSDTRNGLSKFNKAFTLTKGDLSVLLLLVDTNWTSNTTATGPSKFYLQAEDVTWMNGEIDEFDGDHVLILGHHGPFEKILAPDEDSLTRLNNMLSASLAAKASRRFTVIWGHTHNTATPKRFPWRPGVVGYRLPAAVDYEVGGYTVVEVDPTGLVTPVWHPLK